MLKHKQIDYSEIEFRILSQGTFTGQVVDQYTARASEYYDVPMDQVTPAQRNAMKNAALFMMYSWSNWQRSQKNIKACIGRKRVTSTTLPSVEI